MNDIFLSYNREDQAKAKLFAAAFEAQGFKVWWDVGLRAGEAYDEVTEAALRIAKAVVVLWSKKSVQSRWVRAEATLADRNKTLVPCMIEPCERPIMFELTQTAELGHWQGEKTDPAWLSFLADVAQFVGREAVQPRHSAPAHFAAAATSPDLRDGRPSIAILPFTNRSDVRADNVFAGGMGEDVAAALSLVRGLKVISPSVAFAYRKNTSDLRAIGRELGAKYILEGNTRRVGQSLRVTAQLVEAENGAILWTQKFDRPLSELAELQEDLVGELAVHLRVQVHLQETQLALKKPGDITAWEAVMRSWAAYARQTPESMAFAVAEARRAVSLAPDYAVARATLANALAITFQQGGYRDTALIEESIEHAEAALKLSQSNATVLSQAAIAMMCARRFADTLELAERAVELNPNLFEARSALVSALSHFERYDETLFHLDHADRLAPTATQRQFGLGHRSWALYGLGRIEEAVGFAREGVRLDPTGRYAHMSCTVFLQALGRTLEAQNMIRNVRKLCPEEGIDYWVGLARGNYMSETMLRSYTTHFIDAWNATNHEGT